MAPNGLELSCPAEAGHAPLILAQNGGPGARPYAPARRVSFSELLGAPSIAWGIGTLIDPPQCEVVASRKWYLPGSQPRKPFSFE